MDHGEDGASPDEWTHTDDGIELVHGAALYRSRRGTDQDVWEFVVGGQSVGSGHDLAALAEKLRDMAGAIEALDDRPSHAVAR